VSDASWRVNYTSRARRDLRRLDRQVAKRVILALDGLAANDPRSDLRKLSGSDEYRLRVGEWRVRLDRDPANRQITVLRVLPRGRAYGR
jgi:mRNA interferase RelE/StbE